MEDAHNNGAHGVTDGHWPDYLMARAADQPPADCRVVPGSTAVVAFGNPVGTAVATLGINPSRAEFLDRSGRLLVGERRRLATLDSLGTGSWDEVDVQAAEAVLDGCASYFSRRPYLLWFGALDRILRDGLGVSYFDATACHLDLVQWATDPVWGQLPEQVRERLLEADVPFLRQQLTAEGCRVVVVNGRTVMDWVERVGLVRWREAFRLPGPPSATVSVGEGPGPLFVGWSCNLQSQPGARRHAEDLSTALAELAGQRM